MTVHQAYKAYAGHAASTTDLANVVTSSDDSFPERADIQGSCKQNMILKRMDIDVGQWTMNFALTLN